MAWPSPKTVPLSSSSFSSGYKCCISRSLRFLFVAVLSICLFRLLQSNKDTTTLLLLLSHHRLQSSNVVWANNKQPAVQAGGNSVHHSRNDTTPIASNVLQDEEKYSITTTAAPFMALSASDNNDSTTTSTSLVAASSAHSNNLLFKPILSLPPQKRSSNSSILDLLPWENQSLHDLRHRMRQGELRTFPICRPPNGIPKSCCLGSIGSREWMVRFLTYHCFRNNGSSSRSPASFDRVEQAARRELEQTAFLLDNNHNDHNNNDPVYYHRDCDICRIVELLFHHNLTFLATGDSIMLQTMSGMRCELARRGYHVTENTTFFDKRLKVLGTRGISTLDVSGPTHWNHQTIRITYLSQYKPKPDMMEIRDIARTYDVVMMNFGLHWNWSERKEYQSVMAAVFNATKGGNIQLLAFQEPTSQHFNYTAGEWKFGWKGACTPLPSFGNGSSGLLKSDRFRWRVNAVSAASVQAGYKVVVATDASLSRPKTKTGPNDYKELVILPFQNFTAQLFDLHPNECSHYCSTPFLWMPIWRSLRLAMDRQWAIPDVAIYS